MDAGGVQERALPAQAEHGPDDHLHVPKAAWQVAAAAGFRTLLVLLALAVFVFALEVLKAGAGGLSPILSYLDVTGTANVLGFGWFGSYIVLSGSPVAAIGLTLFSQDVISDTEAFALLNGTRMGASFIVVFVGFLYWIGGRRNPDGLYIGVVALLVAFTLWGPVVPIGHLLLTQGWMDGVRIGSPGALTSFVDVAYDPMVTRLAARLPDLLLFAIGVGVLLLSFSIFDRVLPNLESPGPKFERAVAFLQQRYAMFGFGVLVTGLTLSVSLSLTILVPLTLKGYVKRDNIIPYVMGANIATWVDTMFAALLLDAPRAFTVVFVQMLVGAVVSLIVLVLFYGPYKRFILGGAHLATRNRRSFAVFLSAILFVPGVLLLI